MKHSFLSVGAGLMTVVLALRRSASAHRDQVAPLRPQGASEPSPTSPGKGAKSPTEIPPKGWWEIAKRSAKKFSDNELMSEAASVTFFALLSLFPAITAIVSIYGLFNDPSTIQSHLDAAAGFVPSGGMEIIQDQVKRLTQTPASGLTLAAIGGLLAAIWSANQGSKAMFSALNDVYGERETRSFIKKTATSLAFTIGGLVGLLIGIGGIVALPSLFEMMGLDGVLDSIAKIARWPVILLGLVVALSLLYRYGPSRQPAKWRWVTWGGTIAAVLSVSFSAGFSWYVEHFGNYNKTYGSLGAIIGFMTWIWLSSTVVLLGAQINAEMETQTERDTTAGAEKRLGDRGAAAADAVA